MVIAANVIAVRVMIWRNVLILSIVSGVDGSVSGLAI